jgi:octopine/nopaline transport system permease protein
MDLGFFAEIVPKLLAGLPLTLQLAGQSILYGAILAFLLALARRLGNPVIDWPIRSFVALFRGTPLLVQIFLIYYGLGQFRPSLQAMGLWGLFREPYWCAILALTLNTTAYGSEIIRGGLQSVPKGQVEAAQAAGMSPFLVLRRIIPLMEITGIAHGIISQTYRAIEVFACAGAIYLVLNFLITRALGAVEYRLSAHLRPVSA